MNLGKTYRRLDEFNKKDETDYYIFVDALCEHKYMMEAHELSFNDDKADLQSHIQYTFGKLLAVLYIEDFGHFT